MRMWAWEERNLHVPNKTPKQDTENSGIRVTTKMGGRKLERENFKETNSLGK